ncbi:hypothetical protein [Salsipaludibacter albus]|uniref:hypothetical protein n=1 Tax=Salsipaludibacter albus TaxID=2849650 RepID=UPI001EE49A03|nr:hypothetical protein [Salsipaludibacter albus]MBY5162872.1 hypothetical protein [Salsipaludibacter albus]
MTVFEQAVAALQPPMEAIGFAKVIHDGVFVGGQHGDFTPSVGMNSAIESEDAVCAILPILGVAHRPTLERLAELTGVRGWKTGVVVSLPIGSVMPEEPFARWKFNDGNLAGQARSLTEAVESYGVPWMGRMADLDAMRLELDDGASHHVEYKLPVVLDLLGRTDEARTHVEAQLIRLADATHLKAQQHRAFAERFLRELEDGQ